MTNDLSGATILIVEDEAIIAFDLQRTLVAAGARIVGPAMTLAQALALASSAAISAAILDVRLGTEHIAPVAAKLAKRAIPFLFHTGQGGASNLAREWPGYHILPKPAPTRDLLAAVAALIRR